MAKRKIQDENENKENISSAKKTKNIVQTNNNNNNVNRNLVLIESNQNIQLKPSTKPKKEQEQSPIVKPAKKKEKINYGVCDQLPLYPELDITGFGTVKFPLKVAQTERLIRFIKSKNEKNKDVFELDSNSFQLNHNDWQENLESLLGKIGTEFGYSGKANYSLDKLEVYKEGCKLKKRKYDCEKDATLMIQLPSYFSGGELALYNQNNKAQSNEPENIITFGQSDNKASSSIQYLAYHTDLEYEMLEITSGYRLFLIYNLSFSVDTKITDNLGYKIQMLSSLKSTLLKLNSVANQNQHLETSKTCFQETSCTLKEIQSSLAQNTNNRIITKDESNDYKATTGDSFHYGASFDHENQESKSLDNSINESESVGNSNLEPQHTENSNSFKENQKSSITAHQCHICLRMFKLKSNLTAHIKLVHSNLKRFECITCLERFARVDYLKKHLTKCKPIKEQSNAKERIKCSMCNRKFQTNSEMQLHVKNSHKNYKKHKCEQCSQDYSSKNNLLIHQDLAHPGTLKQIEGKEMIECKVCQKKFMFKENYAKHCKLMHEAKQKNTKCSICGLESFSVHFLYQHIRKAHFKETSFECKICGKVFTKERFLQTHCNKIHKK